MADTFRLSGTYAVKLSTGTSSGAPSIEALLDESLLLARKLTQRLDLTVDTPVTISFGGLTKAHVIIIRADAKVKLRLTSADGSTQAVPVEPLFIAMSQTVQFTALDITRVAGQATSVEVFLGECA
jgi:hypothetical protein